MPDENLPLCACGCGERVAHRPGRKTNGYVKGHNLRANASLVKPPPPNPDGLCMCGCGETTSIAQRTKHATTGAVRGEHVKFIKGHHNRTRRGDKAVPWNGDRKNNGYVSTYAPDHPNARSGYVAQHRLVAEQELGRLLAPKEVVHHLNGTRDDNRPENLIVLASNKDHCKLHAWLRAMGIDLDGICV